MSPLSALVEAVFWAHGGWSWVVDGGFDGFCGMRRVGLGIVQFRIYSKWNMSGLEC